MDLRQLQTFVEVVDRGSFSAAADALGISQPAVSQQIASLERGLGEPVIDRSGRRARATERGELVYRHAVRMLAVRDELQDDLAAAGDELAGHLVVGASTGPGEHVLPGLLGRFRQANPRVSVTLRVESTGAIVDHVLDRELEIGVVGARRPHRSLAFRPFLRDRLVLAVPAGHRFAGRAVSLDELVTEPLVVQQEGAGVRRVIESELRRVGMRPREFNVAMELGLQESAKSAVEAGHGVSFLSVTAIAKELALGTLETADVDGIDPVRDFYWVWLAGRPPSRLAERFVEWCASELPGQSAELGSATR
ncbi:MAG: selenium metabolism-associated LysR family transcriptional regulator [Gaiellales bacterium]